MKTRRRVLALAVVCAACWSSSDQALSLPTFQTFIEGSIAQTVAPDEESWFFTGTEFSLFVVGAFGPNDVDIDSVTLLISVPQGEIGTISITSAFDEYPILVTLTGQISSDPLNPIVNADLDVLSDNPGVADGYSTTDFFVEGVQLNNHSPLQDSASDFLLFSLGSFDSDESDLFNYDAAGGGSISQALGSTGEQKEFLVSYTGFSQVHLDVFGAVMSETGMQIRTTWDQNPGSHDATAVVPEPATGVLLALGLGMARFIRRRFT